MVDQSEPPDLEVSLPIPDGLCVTADEPYRILVVADLTGSEHGDLSGSLRDEVVPVTAETLDALLATAQPSVRFTLTDPVAAGNRMVEVALRFGSFRAFDPTIVAMQIPAADRLMKVRERIVARLRGHVSADELGVDLRAAAQADPSLADLVQAIANPPPSAPADSGTVDTLLDQLDLGDGEGDTTASPPRSPVGNLVSAAAGESGGLPPAESSALRKALNDLDHRLSAWLTAVLHAPEVQRIEAAWRSLAWLVSRIDFRKGVRLSILHAPRGALIGRLTSLLIDPVFDEGVQAPDLIAVDTLFGNTSGDLETLDELAQHAASLPAVVVTGVAPSFFGVKHAWQIPTLPPLVNLFDQWQFAKWKSLRIRPHARFLGLVFGRCLLRAPYGGDDADDLAYRYREPCIGDKDFVWGSGPLAAAYTIARSAGDTGWPCGMAGHAHGQIDSLPRVQAGKRGDKWFGPSDTETPQPRVEEMGMVGLNAVVSRPDSDCAVLWNGLTAARPGKVDADAMLEVSLPYQLFAGRLSALMWRLKAHLARKSAEAVIATVRAHLCDWLKLSGDVTSEQLSVQVRPDEEDPTRLQLAATVTPPSAILPRGIPIVMGYSIDTHT